MLRRSIHVTFAAASACLVLAGASAAQTVKASDLKAEVPALTAMHEVIQPMWHDAWPSKDTAALAALAGKLEKHLSAVARAELPGILKDKSTVWREGVGRLRAAVEAYRTAADQKNDEALLKAAEAVHGEYEALVRVVRPVLKEMDDLHQSLYVLYHAQLNPLDLAGAAQTLKAMQAKMVALNAATLPDRLKAKQDAFAAQRARLSAAIDAAAAAVSARDEFRAKEAIELLHLEYEKLEKVF